MSFLSVFFLGGEVLLKEAPNHSEREYSLMGAGSRVRTMEVQLGSPRADQGGGHQPPPTLTSQRHP